MREPFRDVPHRRVNKGVVGTFRIIDRNQCRPHKRSRIARFTRRDIIITDRLIRFVAQDSRGQCFLWAVRWGEAGYGCRSERLTEAEASTLESLSNATSDRQASTNARDRFQPSDSKPRTGSFVDETNAMRFFAIDRDPDLARWARVLFATIRAPGSEH